MNLIYQNIKTTYLLLAAAIFLVNCKAKGPDQVEKDARMSESSVQLTEAQAIHASVETVVPEMTTLSNTLSLNGKLEVMPENIISVSTPMAGFVKGIRKSSGVSVTRGEELLRLEDAGLIQLQQDYLSSSSGLGYARRELERQKELIATQAASEKAFLQAEEHMTSLLITSRSLAEKLRLLHIDPSTVSPERILSSVAVRAPESGTITGIYINTGKYVQPGDELMKIFARKGVKLMLSAYEKDLPYISKGQKIMAKPSAGGRETYTGKVEQVIGDIDANGLARVVCSLDLPSSVQIPGTYFSAQVEAAAHSGWTIPEEALVRHEGKQFVFIEKPNKSYELVEVEPGEHENGRIQIHNGEMLKGSRIVSKGAYTLLMKMKNVGD